MPVTIPCVLMRGGTSKAVFFHQMHLPADRALWQDIILRAFGSPDIRQIDGLGGANSSTSKVAIISPSTRPGVDIDYTFGQVSLDHPIVGMRMNCGNISSAVGPFAIDEGLVQAQEPLTTVRIWNTNTDKLIIARVPVENGRALTQGNCQIHGVPGTGARIELEFCSPGGAVSGQLLPTGHACDTLRVEGKDYPVSLVDAANPILFVPAAALGLQGTELPPQLSASTLSLLSALRAQATVLMGQAATEAEADKVSPELPKVAFCAPAQPYTTMDGRNLAAKQMDLSARIISMGKMINAYMGTGAICTIAAANILGTVVQQCLRDQAPAAYPSLTIGHPFGVMEVQCTLADTEGRPIQSGIIIRTARRIMDGQVYLD